MVASVGIIELTDQQLTLSFNGKSWSSSGYATLSGQSVVFGEKARQQSRINPLVSFNKYWNQLGLDPVQHGNSSFRHHGDFAYHQLMQLHQHAPECKEVILAVPASFNKEQLSLLLGICSNLPFKVIGIVDCAVAGVADTITPGHYLHLDMQLHQCLLTELKVDQNIQIKSADIINGTGLANLYQYWAKYLTGQFIQQCRYDPMHDAQSEQELYDLLPQLLSKGTTQSDEVQLTLNGKQLALNRQSLVRHSQALFAPVLKAIDVLGQHDGIIVTSHVKAVPELFNQLNHSLVLADDATVKNSLAHHSQICHSSAQLSFVTSLPATKSVNGRQPAPTNKRSTHLLWQNAAYPIGNKAIYICALGQLCFSTKSDSNAQFVLQPSAGNLTLKLLNGTAAKVNGRACSDGENLGQGDVLSFGAKEQNVTLINVLKDENW